MGIAFSSLIEGKPMEEESCDKQSTMISTFLKGRRYVVGQNEITFQVETSKTFVRIPAFLARFADMKFARVQNGGKVSENRIKQTKQGDYIVYVPKSGSHVVRIGLNHEFAKICRAENLSTDRTFGENEKVLLTEQGKLFIKFVLPSLSHSKEWKILHQLLRGVQSSTPFGTFQSVCSKLGLNTDFISSLLENKYVHQAKQKLKFPHEDIRAPPSIYRLLGLLNGDGHVNKYSVRFYSIEPKLQDDFVEYIKLLGNYKVKKQIVRGNVPCRYIDSKELASKLIALGAIVGKKSQEKQFNIPNDFMTSAEYLSGAFDTDGAFIEDHHIVISAVKSAKLTCKETEKLVMLGKCHEMPSGTTYIKVPIRALGNRVAEYYRTPPAAIQLCKRALENMGLYSSCQIKGAHVYPEKNALGVIWWCTVTPICDVAAFAAATRLHSLKGRKVSAFVDKYLSKQNQEELRAFIVKKVDSDGDSTR